MPNQTPNKQIDINLSQAYHYRVTARTSSLPNPHSLPPDTRRSYLEPKLAFGSLTRHNPYRCCVACAQYGAA